MGRRRSKWKANRVQADRGQRLLQLVKKGDADAVQALVDEVDAEMNMSDRVDFLQRTQDHTGASALHLAAANGSARIVQILLDNGAGDILLSGGRKQYASTPLHEAALHGHLDVCQQLVDFGSLVDAHTTRGRTPLMYAAKANQMEVARYLLQANANVNEQNEMKATALSAACQRGWLSMVQLLVQHGADVNLCNQTNHSPLHEAIGNGHIDVASYLMEHGAKKDAVDDMGVTMWHEAAGNGDVALLDLLLRFDVPVTDSRDIVSARHPFHYAAIEGHAAFVQAMIQSNLVDVNLSDQDQCTALYYAASAGCSSVVDVLLAAGADVNQSSVRRSPLHCAVAWQHLDCVQLLVQYGASVTVQDHDGLTPLEVAKHKLDKAASSVVKHAEDERIAEEIVACVQ